MKGYYTDSGYIGFVGNQRIIFPTESEYIEYMEEEYGREEE